MVAAVLGIRFRAMLHMVRREWWRGLLVGAGVLWALMMIPSLVWTEYILSRQFWTIRGDAMVVMVAILGLGWVVVPLIIAGLDDTLDPARFRILGVSARRIMPGLVVAALLTLPAVFCGLGLLVLGTAWANAGVDVLVVSYVGLALSFLCMVVGARVAGMWGTRLLASRRAKLVATITVLAVLAMFAALARALFSGGLEALVETEAQTLIEQLAVTPIGAGAAAARSAAFGDWWGVAWRLAMQAAWALVLLYAWRANVAQALVRPLGRGGGVRRRTEGGLDARRSLFTPADPAASAVHARLRRAWLTDPRYLASLAGVILLPAAIFALVVPIFDLDQRWTYAVPLVLAATIGWGRHNDVAYDSTGLWLDVVSGKLGSAVMRGRISVTLAWGLPLAIVVAVATLAWTSRWQDAGGLLGATVGVLGVSLGVAAVFSVLTPYRAPAPGQNPFGAEIGSVGAGLIAQLVSSLAAAAVLPLVTVPFVLGLAVHPGWGWVAAVTGLAVGAGAYVGGVRIASRLYDDRAGRLLGAVT